MAIPAILAFVRAAAAPAAEAEVRAVAVTVTDEKGNPVEGLLPEEVALLENGVARVVTSLENRMSAPILTLEAFNEQTLDSFALQTCRMEFDPEGTGGKVLGNCGGCNTTFESDP